MKEFDMKSAGFGFKSTVPSKLNASIIRSLLSLKPPRILPGEFAGYACVAIILRVVDGRLEIAFIRRAKSEKDPWSGQIAFPGGRKEFGDVDDIATAVRETMEEVGWQLGTSAFAGYLGDVQARNRSGMQNFFLRPLVFFVEENFSETLLSPHEVDAVFWVEFSNLLDPKNQTSFFLQDRGGHLPAIKLAEGDILWGLTHMVFLDLVQSLKSVIK